MNFEVLRTLATPSFFNWTRERRTLETVAFFQRPFGSIPTYMEHRPLPSSFPDFVASFLELRPHMHSQTPWNANLSSLLHHVVDAISFEHETGCIKSERTGILRRLCRHILELKQWRINPTWCVRWLLYTCPSSEFAEQTDTLEFNIFLAEILLGKRTSFEGLERTLDGNMPGSKVLEASFKRKSIVFGSLSDVCIKVGRVELVRTTLEMVGVGADIHRNQLLDVAIHSLNLQPLRLLFSKYESYFRSGLGQYPVKGALYTAVLTGETEAALFLLRTSVDATNISSLAFWILEAASHNNFVFVHAILNDYKDDMQILASLRDYVNREKLPHVALYGHVKMFEYLLDQGFECRNAYLLMFAVVSGGHIPLLRFLMSDARIPEVSLEQWRWLLVEAVAYATRRHFALIEILWTDPALFQRRGISCANFFQGTEACIELFRYSCAYGNIPLICRMAEAGMDLNHLPGFEETPPVLVAHMAGQSTVAKTLVQLGAKPLDPMETQFRRDFENGEYPKVWPRRKINCTYWWRSRKNVNLGLSHEEVLKF